MTEQQVVTLASLVEKEAAGSNDRAIIAGIMLNRLNSNMRLQVDAPVLYYLDKSTVEPEDLKIDSPYNTYLRAGLPPTAIGNPSRDSIAAVLHPTKSNYLFYLHDKNGVAHYAKTFAEHKRNIQQYLIH
jgi:UPF0755 protein